MGLAHYIIGRCQMSASIVYVIFKIKYCKGREHGGGLKSGENRRNNQSHWQDEGYLAWK
ncbi:predicted protein [Histoplasma mississippiense (nom. inval.)]|uniref:predicted protein n=1 Tax=Ajellomyces capsulatus (strain NAm1 / WU24) TaxID=2059318 RepID=UPI000157BD32|nr:predicted protein [Histoplasma mississippiense (nom. inval.)]EDN06141.1 predicted protein [Histoplasma mississippiense (nom. inval.)]